MAARRTSPAREVEAVAEKLHSAAQLLLRRLRTEGDARGISPPRLAALSVVVDTGPIGIGSLAAAEGVSAPTMSRLVDGLERDRPRTTDPHRREAAPHPDPRHGSAAALPGGVARDPRRSRADRTGRRRPEASRKVRTPWI